MIQLSITLKTSSTMDEYMDDLAMLGRLLTAREGIPLYGISKEQFARLGCLHLAMGAGTGEPSEA